MTSEDKLRELRTQIAQAQAKKTRALVDLETATASAEAAKERLKTEFGVETLEEAKSKLTELSSAFEAEVNLLESQLEQAGA